MSRPGYPLAALLRIRERAAEQAQAALGRSIDSLQRAEQERRRLVQAVEAARGRAAQADGARPFGAGQIQAASRYARRLRAVTDRLAACLSEQERRAQASGAAREAARAALASAERERRVVQEDQERWCALQRQEEEKAEDGEMQETAQARRWLAGRLSAPSS